GAITEEQAQRSPFRATITQAVGLKRTVDVALDSIDLAKGDMLLLCTDGLSEKVRPEEMAEELCSKSLSEAVPGLVALANSRGGEDNITVEAARVVEEAVSAGRQGGSKTSLVAAWPSKKMFQGFRN